MKLEARVFRTLVGRALLAAAAAALLPALPARGAPAGATQVDIAGPPGSGSFGHSVTALPNGNIVVTDPLYDAGAIADVGAAYLYDGATGALISTLTGSTAGDQVGSDGVTALSNGNYVVCSTLWDNGGAADAGAVTWGSGTTGVSGAVSAANSLVGSTANDRVGSGVWALSNGNYVVTSPYWDNSTAVDAGAVTWGNGLGGTAGAVWSANSLVGSTAGDMVGYYAPTELSNGNYVVGNPGWDNGGAADAGAATWGSGTTGVSGPISAANSLVGSTAGDMVSWYPTICALSNGNYVITSPYWDNGATVDAGAATWGNGTTGVSGLISAANSLVGSTAGDKVGGYAMALSNGNYVARSGEWDNGAVVDAGAVTWGNGTGGSSGPVSAANSLVGSTTNDEIGTYVTALSNGNYVVGSPNWDNGATADAGAATWGNGLGGTAGAIWSANSLVGSTLNDLVSIDGVTALSNGNYVVGSNSWDNGATADAGAATWGNGLGGTVGAVSPANSLVGSTAGDAVGWYGVTALSNGNYVVRVPTWNNGGVTLAGAATWGNGATGIAGAVSTANSLVGSTTGDMVGGQVTALSNGNYVAGSPNWDDGAVTDAGAATWGNGATGTAGVVSAANSLVGSTAQDKVSWNVRALSNGHYVARSYQWDNGPAADAGAATWGNGATGVSGAVSAANSLVGSTANDRVSYYTTALGDGNYVVAVPTWDNGGTADAGAVTWGSGTGGTAGPVTAQNSVIGTAAGGGSSMVFDYDPANRQLVVGRPADNIVTLFRLPCRVFLPLALKSW